ncbi:hypothetical protein LXM50_12445 [Microbacterium sp. Au-Mic1]|uniref:hypothetical protein n=1 Tax=Microbacterium sp. Au-Mic1 TaxID=2906457 RepID=UPI001E3AA4B4|nr:hypothetical protein [Microbacterium sp. Au-Mic1]MCE4026779.1 hypothetical protein [Microbacterium sp. Au-Mic1]
MAFKTRSGRTVAIGRGAMITARWIWGASSILLIAPLALVVLHLVWFADQDRREVLEPALLSAARTALYLMLMLMLIRVFVVLCAMGTFFGPSARISDALAAIIQSRTGRWTTLSAAATLTLIPILRFQPLSTALITALTLLLVVMDIFVLRGLRHLSLASRARPFFEGMTEEEKTAAARPWPQGDRPSFPDPTTTESIRDALLYQARATNIALAHSWSGAGIALVFSAFIGSAIVASWTDQGPGTMFLLILVLGAVSLGYWLQRRAQSYEGLAERFAARAETLRTARPPRTLHARGRSRRRETGRRSIP